MRNWVVLLSVAGLAGCNESAVDRLPGQDQAEAVVWCEVYHDHHGVPPVEWITRGDPGCPPDRIHSPDGECVFGFFHTDVSGSFIRIAYVTPGAPFDVTSYAHELLHAHLQFTDGDLDPDHTKLEWRPGGLLDGANQALRSGGL